MEKYGRGDTAEILADLHKVIRRAGQAMSTGGFHTPNHRWAVTAALLMAWNITGENTFKQAAERYLAEGIDCDEDGEWTERSSGGYNVVCNNAYMTIAEELKAPEYLEPVRRNLEFMLYHMEPDGSIYTSNSTRQDVSRVVYPMTYYHVYLYMASQDKDGRFMAMANRLMRGTQSQLGYCEVLFMPESDFLYMFLLHPELKDLAVDEAPLPTTYTKHYPKSGLVRVRKGDLSYSITQNNSRFLTFMVGDLRLDLEVRSAFFAIGQFNVSQEDKRWNRASTACPIEVTGDGYRMKFTRVGNLLPPLTRLQTLPSTPRWITACAGLPSRYRHEITVDHSRYR